MVTDMEAGLEHLSRSTTRASDLMLVVAEPYYKSLETAARVKAMATELGIPRTYLVANKVRTPADASVIERFSEKHDLEVIAVIPYDESIAEASQQPAAPLDYCPEAPAIAALGGLADRLATMRAKE